MNSSREEALFALALEKAERAWKNTDAFCFPTLIPAKLEARLTGRMATVSLRRIHFWSARGESDWMSALASRIRQLSSYLIVPLRAAELPQFRFGNFEAFGQRGTGSA